MPSTNPVRPIAAYRAALPRQAAFGQPQRLAAIVCDEHRARGEDARCAALRQGRQIGVDHRVLDVGQRQVGRLRRPRLRARQHQPVARRAGPPGACHREGRLPDAIHQAGIGRIQPVAAGQRPPRPGVEQHAMMPDQQRRALGAVQAERLVSRQIAAGPDPHFQAAAAHQVEHRGILGHPDRQLQRQRDDPGPQTDPRGLRGDLGQKHEGRRQAAFVLVKMVLRDPGEFEAAAFGMHDLRDGQSVALGRVRPIEQAGEKAQPYRRLRCRHPLNLAPCRRRLALALLIAAAHRNAPAAAQHCGRRPPPAPALRRGAALGGRQFAADQHVLRRPLPSRTKPHASLPRARYLPFRRAVASPRRLSRRIAPGDAAECQAFADISGALVEIAVDRAQLPGAVEPRDRRAVRAARSAPSRCVAGRLAC